MCRVLAFFIVELKSSIKLNATIVLCKLIYILHGDIYAVLQLPIFFHNSWYYEDVYGMGINTGVEVKGRRCVFHTMLANTFNQYR